MREGLLELLHLQCLQFLLSLLLWAQPLPWGQHLLLEFPPLEEYRDHLAEL